MKKKIAISINLRDFREGNFGGMFSAINLNIYSLPREEQM